MPYTPTAIRGVSGALYVNTGSATTITKTACEVVSGTIYHVTDPTKRHLDPDTAILVYDNNVLVTAGYYVQAAAGQIVFASAPGGPVTLSGKYFALAAQTMVKNWALNAEVGVIDTTGLGSTARTFASTGLVNWSASAERLHEDTTWQTAAVNGTRVILKMYEDKAAGKCWIGYGIVTGAPLAVGTEDMETETVSFQGDQDLAYCSDDT